MVELPTYAVNPDGAWSFSMYNGVQSPNQTPKGKGLPIGNLNSQFFANVYLNSLDQFVKHTLKCRHYLRYCDGFILFLNSMAALAARRRPSSNSPPCHQTGAGPVTAFRSGCWFVIGNRPWLVVRVCCGA